MTRLLSELTAVTTPVHVCAELQKNLASIPSISGVDFILSPDLELVGNYINDTPQTGRPADGAAFTWNRTPLDGSEGRRVNGQQMTVFSPDMKQVVVGGVARFTMNWRFYTANMDIMEEFELLYTLQKQARGISDITVATTNLGNFTYAIEWNPLESLTFTQSEQFGMYVDGSAEIQGVFLAARPRNADDTIILSINTNITTPPDNVLTSVVVVPDAQNYQNYI